MSNTTDRSWRFSNFGERFKAGASIVELMQDLGDALNQNPDLIFMGGGNPAHIPEVEQAFANELHQLSQDQNWLRSCLGVYQSPQGDEQFRQHLAQLLSTQLKQTITPEHIGISNGSQSAFFLLFNMLAGQAKAQSRHILLPLVPEYIGYGDVGLNEHLFHAVRPHIKLIDKHRFKYQVDFAALDINDQTAALCLSRPTNPTGNVITDTELSQLSDIAASRNVPLILDGAYGLPFPDLCFVDAAMQWTNNTILVLSLSKLGLPGTRTGIVVAAPSMIKAMTHANTLVSLANGNLGPHLCRNMLADGRLMALCKNAIKPFYRLRLSQLLKLLDTALAGLPYRIHEPEGAIFVWIWFEDLPISSRELYEKLKQQGLLVLAGEYFFPGLQENWQHTHECLRLSYAQPLDRLEAGVTLLAKVVKQLY